ncbi:uncharacterized protein [Triticum aestivum]|uniref:uncharacterized protein n=1 Tax=Triticum aestivum TaxID=4565 RepID=UPI001D011BAA|nr:uncharacterized protein LOC123157628 [Triticum aestivum]
MEHLLRLAQFLLASARGDGAGLRRPSPRTRPRTTAPPVPSHQAQDDRAVDGWARDDREPHPLRQPGGVPRGHVSAAASVHPLVRDPEPRLGGEEPCDDLDACSRDLIHCVRKKGCLDHVILS